MPLNTLLRRHATYRPDHLAVVFERERLTMSELEMRVNRLANVFCDLGLTKGDKIAVFLDNSIELIEVYHAVAKTGIVVVPLSPLLRGDGLVNLVNDSDAAAFVTMARLVPEVEAVRARLGVPADRYLMVDAENADGYRSYRRLTAAASDAEPPPVEISHDDPYNIVYSSGTTGSPKGIVHTHRVREAYCTGFASSFRVHPESVVLHAGSLVFNGAFLTLMPAFYLGCKYVLLSGFEARRMIDTLAGEQVTHTVAVPSQLIALLEHDDFDAANLPYLEAVISVGAPLLLEHKEELMRRLPNRLYELYGLTEGFVTILDRDDYARKPGSVGVPPPLYEMRILDDDGGAVPAGAVGEIVGHGPITMPGYYKRPDLTAETLRDGWVHSGDLGYVDDEGFLFLVDRKKDMLISGGVNVYPRDIEEILIQHPDVVDVAVFGAPDEKWGESAIAAVRLRASAEATAPQLREWVNERVEARYQKVREVLVRDEFPLSVAGKTLRRVLRADYLEATAPPTKSPAFQSSARGNQ